MDKCTYTEHKDYYKTLGIAQEEILTKSSLKASPPRQMSRAAWSAWQWVIGIILGLVPLFLLFSFIVFAFYILSQYPSFACRGGLDTVLEAGSLGVLVSIFLTLMIALVCLCFKQWRKIGFVALPTWLIAFGLMLPLSFIGFLGLAFGSDGCIRYVSSALLLHL